MSRLTLAEPEEVFNFRTLGSVSPGKRQLRRDAQRNRDALVEAAREVFGRKGIDTPLDEIASRAGVSIGTLYNHFPTRSELIDAAFREHALAGIRLAEEALGIEDPWEAFTYFLTKIGELQAADRGYTDVCTRTFPDAPALEEAKARGAVLVERLVARAKQEGVLREDFSATDLALVGWSLARTSDMTRDVAPRVWRRHLGFLLDGLRADRASPQNTEALAPEELARAMRGGEES